MSNFYALKYFLKTLNLCYKMKTATKKNYEPEASKQKWAFQFLSEPTAKKTLQTKM
jgi:hypothetical protein